MYYSLNIQSKFFSPFCGVASSPRENHDLSVFETNGHPTSIESQRKLTSFSPFIERNHLLSASSAENAIAVAASGNLIVAAAVHF